MVVIRREVKVFLMMFFVILAPMLNPVVKAEVPPSIRYLYIESAVNETFDLKHGMDPENPILVDCVHYTFVFALWKVPTWSDKCYFDATLSRKVYSVEVPFWIGFSQGDANKAPGFQGGDFPSNILQVQMIMAEFPYKSEIIMNPLDGAQRYWFYRFHIWVEGKVEALDRVDFVADYMKKPGTITTLTSFNTFTEDSATGSTDSFKLKERDGAFILNHKKGN